HPAEVHVADHRTGAGPGDVVLDEHAVLEDRDLGTVALLAYRHGPVDRLAPGQELRLGQDRWPGTPLLPPIPAALALGFQPGRAGHALYLVAGCARLTHLDDGDHAVLCGLGVASSAAAPATPAAPGQRLLGLGLVGLLDSDGLVARLGGFLAA